MWLIATVTALLVIYLISKCFLSPKHGGDLKLIPGPPPTNPLWNYITGKTSDPFKLHLTLSALAKKYGPIFKIQQGSQNIVVLSNQEGIYQLTVKGGKEVRGRNSGFRFDLIFGKTGILGNHETDAKWKALRKHSQKHLKQYGDGMNRLERIISIISEDMFQEINTHIGVPFDPRKVIGDTTFKTIVLLVTGVRAQSGDPIVRLMTEFEKLLLQCAPIVVPLGIKLLDVYPWLRYFGLPSWKYFERLFEVETGIWNTVNSLHRANPDAKSLYNVLKEHIRNDSSRSMTDTDIRKTILSLLAAGRFTTSFTFYALVNILSHHKDIQEKIASEVHHITNGIRDICLEDKADMHFVRATILEVHRYVSILPIGVRNTTTQETILQGYTIPKNTYIIPNLWELHHDPTFWTDPFAFCPERFLDNNGELVPADHPNRKHLLPFGGGLRVCVGETFANTRLLLWTASIIQRYEITPADGNHITSTDPRNFRSEAALRPTSYEVIFNKRRQT